MTQPMRLRATESGGVVDLRVLMTHPMETGLRRGGDGAIVARHYITDVTARVGDRVVMTAQWSPAVSTNPFLHLRIRGARRGDQISVTWRDSNGATRTDQVAVT